MSEMTNGNFTVPPPQDFDTVGFQGSMQQVLQENIGNYVIVDFLIGTGNLESRQGVLYTVASQFLVLFDDINLRYVVCDIFSVKFVTFLLPGYRPGQVRQEVLEELRNQAATGNLDTTGADVVGRQSQSTSNVNATETMARMPVTTAQAAYAHAVRKTSVEGAPPRR